MVKESAKGKAKITKELPLPDNVNASMNEEFLLIKGPNGELRREIKHHNISIRAGDKKIVLESEKGLKEDKKIIGSLEAHVKNMISGSMQSHTYTLKICSGHFPMNVSVSGNKLAIKNFLGEKVPRTLQLKEKAEVKIEGDIIRVSSISKEIAGQVSADIEQLTRRPGFDTRIFQDGIYIINKDGKEMK